jgi:hypothetical protein
MKNNKQFMEKWRLCPACEKHSLVEVDNITSEMDGYVFMEKGRRCSECGEEFINEKDAQRTIEAAKKLGIWPQPLKLHRSLSKSGRGLVLRIPSDIEKDFKLIVNPEKISDIIFWVYI